MTFDESCQITIEPINPLHCSISESKKLYIFILLFFHCRKGKKRKVFFSLRTNSMVYEGNFLSFRKRKKGEIK